MNIADFMEPYVGYAPGYISLLDGVTFTDGSLPECEQKCEDHVEKMLRERLDDEGRCEPGRSYHRVQRGGSHRPAPATADDVRGRPDSGRNSTAFRP